MQYDTRPSAAFQKLIGQPSVGFKSLLKRGECTVHHDNMHRSAWRGRRGGTRILDNLAKSILPNLRLYPMPEGHDDLSCVLQHAPNPLRREGHIGPRDTFGCQSIHDRIGNRGH